MNRVNVYPKESHLSSDKKRSINNISTLCSGDKDGFDIHLTYRSPDDSAKKRRQEDECVPISYDADETGRSLDRISVTDIEESADRRSVTVTFHASDAASTPAKAMLEANGASPATFSATNTASDSIMPLSAPSISISPASLFPVTIMSDILKDCSDECRLYEALCDRIADTLLGVEKRSSI